MKIKMPLYKPILQQLQQIIIAIIVIVIIKQEKENYGT